MRILRLGTLNCQNNYDNRKAKQKENAVLLANHIMSKQYDILGVQELTMGFEMRVNLILESYNIYGCYQFGTGFIGTRLPIIKDYNESNPILTRVEAKDVITKALPWIPDNLRDLWRAIRKPSLKRRIATIVHLEKEERDVYIINTHLDYHIPRLQRKQLEYLHKKIKKYSEYGEVAVMGDFNLQITNPMFVRFENQLNELGIRRVRVDKKTNADRHASKTAIDHIFVPTAWKIVACGAFDTDDLRMITDHKAVYVDVVF